ncbi:MAG: DctP family TRAP transporter solute-binding subunit [Syntrophorhabdaceae bacterium]|nr:DctP family TRAP transporter solute-binding subunit [Syntrophorhabdaceae bacterium]
MMKRSVSVFIAFVMVLLLVTAGSAQTYKPEYKMSIVVGPAGPWGEGAARFAEAVRKYTDGRINIKPYYSGQLFAGKQTNEFLLMKQGVIDFALGSTINWSTTVKELNIFSMPFFFPDYKALDAVENGEVGKRLFKIIEEKGVVGLGWAENGYRELTNSKRAVKKPEDMDGLKVRVVGSPIFIDTFKAMGANPVSMNWGEALSAFQQGTVDGQENPVVSVIIPNKLWQVHKYATIWHYAIDPLILGVSKEVWDGFSAQDKEAIKKAADETVKWQKKGARAGLEGSMETLDTLRKNGMDVTVLTPKQVKVFKGKTKSVHDKWAKDIGTELVVMAEKDIQKAMKGAAKPAPKAKTPKK